MSFKSKKKAHFFNKNILIVISKAKQLLHGLAHSINYHFITANVVFFIFLFLQRLCKTDRLVFC